MERQGFIKRFMALGFMFSGPITLIAKTVRNFRIDSGFFVKSGKDRFEKEITLLEGDTFFTKVSTKDTDGDIYVFESTRIKEGGPSLHYHYEQDEWWYVLKGEFQIKVGDITHNAKVGDSVFGPRMIPHTFSKIGEGEGKLLMFFQPAGRMEEFFTKLSAGAAKGLTEEQMDKMREDHRFKRVGPPISYFKKLG